MKTKNGKLVLGTKDTRLGNFILTDQPEYYKIADINARFSVQIHKTTLTGRVITLALDGKLGGNYLQNLCVVLYETALTALDTDAMQAIVTVCHECVNKHPELYGGATKDTDADALKEAQEVAEFIQNTKTDGDKED